jgi:hypothetical protein
MDGGVDGDGGGLRGLEEGFPFEGGGGQKVDLTGEGPAAGSQVFGALLRNIGSIRFHPIPVSRLGSRSHRKKDRVSHTAPTATPSRVSGMLP